MRQKQCTTCHTIGTQGGTVGPVLNQVGLRRTPDWLRKWLKDPNSVKAGTRMPNFQFTEQEIEDLVVMLEPLKHKVDGGAIVEKSKTSQEAGEALFDAYDCYACHRIGNRGRFIGPELTWVARRRPEVWEHDWLSDPAGVKPGTFMPDFKLTEPEILSLAAFLQTLNGQHNQQSRQWEDGVTLFLDSRPHDRGEKVYLRLACWSCHGDNLRGGIRRNDNMVPGNLVPAFADILPHLDESAVARVVRGGKKARPIDESAPAPLGCPAYGNAVNEKEMTDLFIYLTTLVPRKSRFVFK